MMMVSRIVFQAILALGIYSLATFALAEDLTITKAETFPVIAIEAGLTARDETIAPHDCGDILRRGITPQIDCSYSEENCGFQDDIEYIIRIKPIGKVSTHWCGMMRAQVAKETNSYIEEIVMKKCDRTYEANENGNGMWLVLNIQHIHFLGDRRPDVERAIRNTMCPGGPKLDYWVNEGCYRSSICSKRYWNVDKRRSLPDALDQISYPRGRDVLKVRPEIEKPVTALAATNVVATT
ncbi:hypothetical protein CCUS01_12367 [Colletotrichum cuscutae]|uniref:Uncharacterized protein n=1 Tax=Colletotrichum cuscutae TaxID=1209917 RepID=A0AAI9TVC2_9PEZI|nr:hypothetical protein CCUS01_12367 [Colletotrichum cuscutae]